MKLTTAVKTALRGTDVATLQKLLNEQSRWQRKQTIAANKLGAVRRKIDQLCTKLAAEKNGVKL